jgi:hypothetical protein
MSYIPGPVPQSLPAVLEYLSRELQRISAAFNSSGLLLVRQISTTTTVSQSDEVITVDATGGAVTVALPPIARARNRHLYVKKIDASANAVTVNPFGSETVDGAATVSTTTQYGGFELVAGSTEWHLL